MHSLAIVARWVIVGDMFASSTYELVAFGAGRRLERFGDICLDRPCPTAEGLPRSTPAAWSAADARFERTGATAGRWLTARHLPERWTIAHGPNVMELKCTESGQVGVFPEQAANWDWIVTQRSASTQPLKVLNLFAYTGGSTLAAAAAGAEVVHVDAAHNVVSWARRNAELAGLAHAPIRWITEDVVKFVRRELKREARYDAVILDPPSYGHGAQGEVWNLSQLAGLLALCGQLTAGRRRFILLTCHTPDYTPIRLRRLLATALGDAQPGRIFAGPMVLSTASGQQLPSGAAARWQAAECDTVGS
ncbi:MAG: class I SAM-dependent methyltransferase [Planctomycetota bacterium]|nr:class I SAM-dependent methyltransferase [Planctomycetota bacterium]